MALICREQPRNLQAIMTAVETSEALAPADGARARRLYSQWVLSAGVLTVSLGVLLTAAMLDADPSGMGTHQRLGLAPCGLLSVSGIPCATCGMTTAFTHAAHGRFISALAAQPAGTVLAIVTAILALLSAYCLIVRISMIPILGWFWRIPVVIGFAGMILASWIYKILVVQGNL
jgi:hypothetical protein